MALPSPGQRPRHTHHDLAFAETPEINAHADDVVEPGVGALVQQQRGQAAQRVHEQSGFDAPVHRRQRRRCPVRRSRGRAVGVCVFVAVLVCVGGCCCCCCCCLGGVVVGGGAVVVV